jgi:transaldolase
MAFVSAPFPVARSTFTSRPSQRSPLRPCAARSPSVHVAARATASSPSSGAAPTTATRLPSQYDQLAAMTTIVEDTGEIDQIARHRPFAATTNPSLVYKAADLPEYADIIDSAIEYGKTRAAGKSLEARLAVTRNNLFVRFGARILEFVEGDVSTEVDARLSFDADAQVATALDLIRMYGELGVDKKRVLIKLATTWEGVQACRFLEKMGIRTNMTLLFNTAQAAVASDAGAYLVSPFVGRIADWYRKRDGRAEPFPAEEDPGVISVRDVYNYFKCTGSETVVMGASFRNLGEILALAGCDRLTIAPNYISDLKESHEELVRMLHPPTDACDLIDKVTYDEASFRWAMNQDPMATEKLHEGIRGFAKDLESLDDKLRSMMD